jgi:thiol-disulfide isomerase/thioredoxin
MVLLMIAAVGLLIWAGVYNLRARRVAMERERNSHITLTKDGSGGTVPMDAGGDTSGLGTDLRGKPAPTFALKSLDGKKVTSADFKGHPMVINFWATYCGPCKLEMPWFEEFSHKYAGQGLDVLGVDDEDGVSNDDVRSAAKKVGVTYPIVLADRKTESAWGLGDYLPVTFYVDAQGIVREQTAGAPSKETVEANIQKILTAAK